MNRVVAAAVLALLLVSACSGSDAEPSVEFDGSTCSYSGPLEYEAGSIPSVELRNTGDVSFEFVLLEIDAGLTYEDVARLTDGLTVYGFDMPEGIRERGAGGLLEAGEERTTNIGIAAAGTYLPACLERPDTLWFISEQFITAS